MFEIEMSGMDLLTRILLFFVGIPGSIIFLGWAGRWIERQWGMDHEDREALQKKLGHRLSWKEFDTIRAQHGFPEPF